MIRKLMASTAMLALMTAGSYTIAQAQTQPAQTEPPAVVEQEEAPPAEVAESEESLVPEEPTLATAFIGQSVFSSEDPESDNIGDVSDLIIGDDGAITHAVVGVGGFLGIGEKQVAVPFDELQVVEQEGEIRLVYAATKEQLEAAEEFDRTAYDPGARFAEEQAALQPDPVIDPAAPAGTMTPAPADDLAAVEEPEAGADTATPEAEGEMAAVDAEPAPAEDMAAADATEPAEGEAAPAEDMAAADATEPADATAPAEDLAAADATAPADAPAEETAAADAEAPAGEELAAADAEATTSTDGETFIGFNADQIRATTLMGQEVYGADEESIGEISDLVLQEDGATRAAIIDVGGFLGVGEKSVAIPFEQIEIQPQEGADPRLVVAMSREELEQAPAFEDATTASEDLAATEQTGVAGVEEEVAADAAADPAAEQDVAADTSAAPAAGEDLAADATETPAGEDIIAEGEAGFELATQDLSADDLIGTTVLGTNEENIGEVGDVVFAQSGEIEAVVIDVGGFLGIGEKPVAVQFDALNVQKDTAGDMQLMINASQEQLEAAPSYNETDATAAAPAQ